MKGSNYRYSAEIARYEKLDEEQYAATMEELRSPVDAVREAARERLICSHLRMVVKRAVTYARIYGVSANDLISVGNEALVYAADRFDPARKIKFSSYVWKIVPRWIKAYHRKQNPGIRFSHIDVDNIAGAVPAYGDDIGHSTLRMAMKSLTSLEQDILYYSFFDDFEPPDKEIAEKLRLSTHSLKRQREEIDAKLRHLLRNLNLEGYHA